MHNQQQLNQLIDRIRLPHWSKSMFLPRRYKVPYGGRGSSKSWTVADALLMISLKPSLLFNDGRTKLRILCTREYQNSIEESVHHLLDNQAQRLKIWPWLNIQQRSITTHNGSEFIFAGIAKNVNKIKSMEDLDICWVEEAEMISNNSWKVLIPTLRKRASEIWLTFNPNEESDPTYSRFVVNTPPDCELIPVNWKDNPWFPKELRKEKDYLFKVDPEAAEHVWNGKCNTRSEAVIFRGKYHVESFIPVTGMSHEEDNWKGPYYGCDWGFSVDPTVLMKMWIFKRKLYIEKESYHHHLELDEIAPTWKREIPECAEGRVIRADCSRPETISHVRKSGLNVQAADKWSGSVEDGIAFLRSFEDIIIHPRCEHQREEARLYKYKVDKITGDVLTDIVDMHNHTWDSDRYALEPAIKGKKSIYDYL
jgi:phage terminase large subunit